MKYKNILVPTDFSHGSAKAYEFACDLACSKNSFLNLIHIVEPLINSKNISYGYGKSEYEAVLNAEEKMRRFASTIPKSGVKIFEIVKVGIPHEEILNFAEIKKIDLIVIASCACSKSSSLGSGGVGDKIIKYANAPVICLKTNDFLEEKNFSRFEIVFAENWVG